VSFSAPSCSFSPPPSALAWGKAGHRVVATLATNLLTPEATFQIVDLLGPGVTLADSHLG
jgi:hypothetical protein